MLTRCAALAARLSGRYAPDSRRRRSVIAVMVLFVLTLAGVSAAKVTPGAGRASGATRASSAAVGHIHYRSLEQLGVTAKSASLDGRVVNVTLSNTRRVEVRLAVIRNHNRKLQAWSAVTLKPRSRVLVRRLNAKPTGPDLNLRVTARIGSVRARAIIALRIVTHDTRPPTTTPTPPATSPPPPAPAANHAPTSISLSSDTVAENQPAATTVGSLSAADADAADTLGFALVPGTGSDDNAAFTIAGTALRTAASFDFETKASYAIRVRVADGRGGTFDRALTISITNVDDPPVAVNDLATVLEDSGPAAVAVLANDTDADGGPKSIASVTQPAHGTVVMTGGGTGLTYAPNADYCNTTLGGPDTFTYSLNGASTATASMTVTCVNDAPTIVTSAGPLSYTENDPATPVDAGVVVQDVDSATLSGATVQITGGHTSPEDVLALPAQPNITAAYNPATGTLTLSGADTVAAYQAALHAVTYRNTSTNPSTLTRTVSFLVTDASSTSAPATRTIAITATNNAPDVATSAGAVAYTENDPATAIDTAVTISDPDSALLTGATVRVTGNYVQGEDVLGLPAQPNVAALAFDAPTGTLTLTGSATISDYEAALAAVTYRNTSDNPSTATRTATYQARDAGGFGVAGTHAITVTAVDDPPVAVNDSATVAEDSGASAVAVRPNDTDVDGGPISIQSVTQPANGTVAITGTGSGLTYAPNADYCNTPPGTTPDSFTYTLTPGGSTATVVIAVTCVDDPPVAVNDAATVGEDSGASPIAVLVNDTDIDGGPRSVLSVTQPANGTVVITGGGTAVSYAPNANSCNTPPGTSPDTFTYTLNGGSTATAAIAVTCIDDPPVAVNDSATVAEDSGAGTVDVRANDTDVDGGLIAVASVTQPSNGAVTIIAGGVGVRYTPNTNSCNAPPGTTPDTFTYTLNGGSTATVSMTVTCSPDAPVVNNTAAALTYTENDPATPVDPGVTVTDADTGGSIASATVQITSNYAGPQDSLALSNAVAHAPITAFLAGATLTLSGAASPAAYQSALRDVTYVNSSEAPSSLARTATFTVTDNTALSGSAARAIQVISVDDDPVAVADSATVLEDPGAASLPVLANDTDVDGGPLAIAATTQPANGTVVITGGGSGLTYQPDPNYCNDTGGGGSPDTFTYTLTPGGSTATVAMTVTCLNDAPTAANDTFSAASSAIGNTALVVNAPADGAQAVGGPKKSLNANILANDGDVDGPGPLTVVAGTFPSNDGGTVVIESDGDFTFTPAAGTSCTDTSDFFDYTVTDGNTPTPGTAVGRVTIAITGCVWYVNNNAPGNAGTSTAPFDTLAQAQSASAAGQTIFLEDGDNTTTGYDAGIDLKANQRLIGEAADLQIGADLLQTGILANRPTITDAAADAVALASGNTVRGIEIDPAGGSAIAGAAGDAGGTIDDVRIIDTGTPGSQPGLELDGTSGTFDVSNLTLNTGTSSTTGLRLNNNSGVVNFLSAGTISLTTNGAKALDATSTNLGAGSVFDDITVTNSSSGAVNMINTTGTTTFSNLALTTTSGATGAFVLNNAGAVTVSSSGTANVTSNGGPAIDVSATSGPTLAFDNVSVASSAASGIFLNAIGAGTFSATGGTLAGVAGGAGSTAFRVSGGSGTISYGGDIADGTGGSVLIQNRTGGTITLSGTITDGPDVNGGPSITANSGGATVFSHSGDTFSSGAGSAVSLVANTGHTISFTGGGLNVDTTSGAGFAASGGGTVTVTGTGNTIDTGSGSALLVDNTNIGAGDMTFEHVSTNGAAVGIRANATGASGRLVVTGNGGTCTNADTSGCSGGTLANLTGADDSTASPPGTGIVLASTLNPSFTRMWIHDASNYAIRGTSVAGFTLANSVINGANGTNGTTPFDDSSVWIDNLTGSATVINTHVSGGFEDNFRVVNTAGSLNRITFTSDTIGDNSTAGGNDGILLESSSSAGQLQGTVQSSTFTGAGGDLLQYDHNGSGTGDLVLTGNVFSNNHPGIATGGGGLTLTNGGTSGATTMSITGANSFRDAVGNALTIAKSTGTSTQTGTFSGNTIGVNGLANSGSAEGDALKLQTLGQGTSSWTVTNNVIRGYNNFGVEMLAGGSATPQNGAFNATITGNTIDQPGTTAGTLTLPKNAVHMNIGTVPGDTYQACAVIGGSGALANNLAGGGAAGLDPPNPPAGGEDVRLRQRQSTTLRLPGYGGPSDNNNSAVQAFVATNNPSGGPTVAASISGSGGGFTGTGSTCP